MSLGLAAAAALLLGLAAAAQQRAAGAQPPHRPLSVLLVWDLLRNRAWLLAVALMVLAYGLQAAALGEGELALVEPILSAYLVVALLVGAVLSRRLLTLAELAAAVGASSGIALFLLQLSPGRGTRAAPGRSWAEILVLLALVLLAALPLIWRATGSSRAMVLGALAGLTLGVSDALTKQTIAVVATHRLGSLATWEPYLLLVVGALGFLLQQSAYHAGPLSSGLPPLSVLEPVAGTLLGLIAFRESIAPSASPTLLVAAVALMLWGVQRLARSELVVARSRAPADG
ncbi:MAG: DMT family transporter [Candidatus Dormibacteraeota bacterium]|nr:DMT family transporter [Candidatus Dormibacteraeota bacterium]